MAYSQKSVARIERSLPERAARAVRGAYKANLRAGNAVLIVKEGAIFRINPDLTSEKIKVVPDGVKIAKGTKFKIK